MGKTRNLSVAEYFIAIQIEYLIAEFRKKIYFNPKDKAYYEKVMKFKADKINDIASRNSLNSILNDDLKKEELKKELFNKNGKPTFDMDDTDIQNYYSIGNEFSLHGNIWILDHINDDGTLNFYSKELKKYTEADKNDVCRIL